MSASEPDTAADPSSAPGFPVVEWGYDRQLVDIRVAELVQQLADERRRGDHARQALSELQLEIEAGRKGPDGRGGPRADPTEVLAEAGVIAARVLAEAGRRIEATIVVAGEQAAHRLNQAAQEASTLERQAHRTLAEAAMERARIEAAASSAADQVRARADREARAVVAKAREDAELAWQSAVRQRRRLQAEAEALATLRQRTVEQLGRLYAPLGLVVVDAADYDQREMGGVGTELDHRGWPSC